MKASELVEKLNKLIEINPDANVYFYADEDSMKFVESRYLKSFIRCWTSVKSISRKR